MGKFLKVLDEPDTVTFAELARRKRVSRQAIAARVGKLEAFGLLKVHRKGRQVQVSLEAFDKAVEGTTSPAFNAQSSQSGPFHRERTRREAYRSELARLDLQQRQGRVVLISDVERRIWTSVRRARDRLLGIPSSVANRIAAAPDEVTVRALLDREIVAVLDELTEDLGQKGSGAFKDVEPR